jgi:hypothetical protein
MICGKIISCNRLLLINYYRQGCNFPKTSRLLYKMHINQNLKRLYQISDFVNHGYSNISGNFKYNVNSPTPNPASSNPVANDNVAGSPKPNDKNAMKIM